MKRLVVALAVLAYAGTALAQEAARGSCDSGAAREIRSQLYNVETRKDTEEAFMAKAPCTDQTVAIKRCSIAVVRNLKIQRFCHGGDRPAYYEFVDTVEYWESLSVPKSD